VFARITLYVGVLLVAWGLFGTTTSSAGALVLMLWGFVFVSLGWTALLGWWSSRHLYEVGVLAWLGLTATTSNLPALWSWLASSG